MKRVKIPIFLQAMMVYLGDEESDRYSNDSGSVRDLDDLLGAVTGEYIWLSDDADESTVLHESSHVVTNMMEFLDCESDEVRSYVLEFVYGKLIQIYRRWKSE